MANPLGKQGPRDKPYRDALRMEIAAAGADHKLLRQIAKTHLDLAASGDMHAIREMADRLDGKPALEATVTHITQVTEWTDQEIAQRIIELGAGRAGAANGNGQAPVDPSKLN